MKKFYTRAFVTATTLTTLVAVAAADLKLTFGWGKW